MPNNRRKRQRKAPQPNVEEMVTAFRKLVTSNPVPSTSATSQRRRRRKRSKPVQTIGEMGTVHLSRRELLGTMKVSANSSNSTGHFDLLPSSFSLLNTISASFDRIQWKKLNVFYKPAVGTTVGGLVSVGMDWDWKTPDSVSRAKISGLTPSFSCAVWQDD